MKKYYFLILFLIVFLFLYGFKAFSNEGFSDRYSFQNASGNTNIKFSSKNEEVLFIVDFSGSMNKRMGDKTLLKHALDSIKSILQNSDSSLKIGLRIFGYYDKDISLTQEELCHASSLILPIAKYNSTKILDRLHNTTPFGLTPITFSLNQAVQNDFNSDEGTLKHIILVTDGAENCGGDPCAYIRHLMKVRDDYKIDVIGISISLEDYEKISCISGEGRGQFYRINSPEDFKIIFEQALMSTPSVHQQQNVNNTNINSQIQYKNYLIQFYE